MEQPYLSTTRRITIVMLFLFGLLMGIIGLFQFLFIDYSFASGTDVLFLPDQQEINQELLAIDLFQYEEKTDLTKYKFIPTYTKDNYKYTIHEYVTPNQSIGYQVFIENETEIISLSTGIEANSRTFTFVKPITKATTTPEL